MTIFNANLISSIVSPPTFTYPWLTWVAEFGGDRIPNLTAQLSSANLN